MNKKSEQTGKNASNQILAFRPESGDVFLSPLGEYLQGGYRTGLAAYIHIREMNHEDRKKMVFITAMHLIIRDKCNPDAVHRALLGLDEYRDGCSEDMPGMVQFNG